MTDKPNVLIVGLDGATFDIIKPMLATGELPALAGLMERGGHCVLKSTIPANTPCAWTTFATGVGPGKHGILELRYLVPGTYHLRRSSGAFARSRSLWSLLEDAGFSVGIYNVPWTDPSTRRGYAIGGLDLWAAEERCHPPQLAREITEALGPDALSAESPLHSALGEAAAALAAEVQRDTAVATHLLRDHPTDVFAVVFMAIDAAQHLFYGPDRQGPAGDESLRQALASTYQQVDNAVGRLLEWASDDTTVLVVSDHGARPCHALLNLNGLLADLGLLTFRDGLGEWPAPPRPRQSLRRRLLSPMWHPIRDFVRQLFPGRAARWARPSPHFATFDLARTTVFSLGRAPLFRVNLRGREPEGTVPPADYESFCDEVVAQLRAYTDPQTGEPVFGLAAKASDLYDAPAENVGVDVVAQVKDYAHRLVHLYHPEAPVTFDYETWKQLRPGEPVVLGNHDRNGICILAGPDIPPRTEPAPDTSIADVAPTLLYLLDRPIPREMDGQVMAELLGPTRLRARPPSYADTPLSIGAQAPSLTYGPQEARKVEQRLRDLGYLD